MLNNTDPIFVNEMHWLLLKRWAPWKSIQSTRRGKHLERSRSGLNSVSKKQVQQHVCPSGPLYKVWFRSLRSPNSTLEGREEPQSFELKKESMISVVSCSIIQMNMKAGLWTLIHLLQLSKTPAFEHMIQRLRNREKDFTINRLQWTTIQTLQTC